MAVFGLPCCHLLPLPPIPCCHLCAISLAVSSCTSSACVPTPSPCPLPCPSVSISLAISLRLSLSPSLVQLAPLLLLPLLLSPPHWPRCVRAHQPHLPDPFLAVSPSLPGARGCAPLPSPSPSRCHLLAVPGVQCVHTYTRPLPSLPLSRPPTVSPLLAGAHGCAPLLSPSIAPSLPLPSPSPSPSCRLLLATLGVHCAHLHQAPQPIHLPSLALSHPPAVPPFRRGYRCTTRPSPPCCQVRMGVRPCHLHP